MKKLRIIRKLLCRHGVVLLAAAAVAMLGCPIYELFGICCPLCGTTRAWVSFLTGEIPAAFRYHPLFLIIPPWFFAALHYGSIFKKNKVTGAILLLVAVLLLAVNLLRLTGVAFVMPA